MWRLLITFIGIYQMVDSRKNNQNRQNSQPHIIMIVMDDIGWNDVPWHNPDSLAVNLGKYAREGVRLERHYVHSKCSPSRAALLTGRLAWTMGRQRGAIERFHPTGLSTNFTLLPERLKEAGYATHAIGKWHLGYCNEKYLPTRRGFDTFFGILQQLVHYRTRDIPCATHKFRKEMIGYDLWRNENITHDHHNLYSPLMYAEEAREVISNHDPETPLFLYLPFMAIHTPFVGTPPKKLRRLLSVKSRKIGVEYNGKKPDHSVDPWEDISTEEMREIVLVALDRAINKVINDLKRHNLYDNSVILVTTDNGGGLGPFDANSPLKGTKDTIYEGGIRGASFILSPLLKQSGYAYEGLIHLVDWFPTMLGLAGAPVKDDIDGVDVWSALVNNRNSPRNEIIHNIDEDLDRNLFQACMMEGHYKLIWGQEYLLKNKQPYQRYKEQLYDVFQDPEERNNIASSNPQIVQRLKDKLLQAKKTKLVEADYPKGSKLGWPSNRNGIVGPGWC